MCAQVLRMKYIHITNYSEMHHKKLDGSLYRGTDKHKACIVTVEGFWGWA